MSDNDLPDFAGRLNDLAAGLGGPALKNVLTAAGLEGRANAASAGRADLGADGRFSGWPKAALGAKYVEHSDGLGITIHREAKSAGPWRVAEEGRNAGQGPPAPSARLTKTGKVSKARGKRWNGRTMGKSTWSDAEALMTSNIPNVVESEVLKVMMGWVNGK